MHINDTCRSILGGKEKRRLELYDADKNSLLYRNLLTDDGNGQIAVLMRQLHDNAYAEIEADDRRRKRNKAMTEFSGSHEEIDGASMEMGSIEQL